MGSKMSKKILICGSSGFLMSNFIRYLLYRTKEYDIVSVDFVSKDNYKRIYKHKKHRFYLGNSCDEEFIQNLYNIEQPDFIINSFPKNNNDTRFSKTFHNLCHKSAKMIQIVPTSYNDYTGKWEFLKHNNGLAEYFKSYNTILEIPHCFGIRQDSGVDDIRDIINTLIENREVYTCDYKFPWVYAEDVASLLWFIIESKLNGYYKMPELGYKSRKDIAILINKILNKQININIESTNINVEYKGNVIENWMPDSKNLDDSLIKTISWYNANKWALR
jgi:dTDP-D-glucose 4,6-dehydratase